MSEANAQTPAPQDPPDLSGLTAADVSFRAATVEDADVVVPLMRQAIGTYNDFMWGTDNAEEIEAMLRNLYVHPKNRFSHTYAVVAVVRDQVVGFFLGYRSEELDKLVVPTTWQLLKNLGFAKFLTSVVANADKLMGKEAGKGEFHVYIIGVDKAYRRLGVATMFVFESERIARETGCIGVSCTADPKHKALQAGLALGYEIVETIELGDSDTYYRVLKIFDPKEG